MKKILKQFTNIFTKFQLFSSHSVCKTWNCEIFWCWCSKWGTWTDQMVWTTKTSCTSSIWFIETGTFSYLLFFLCHSISYEMVWMVLLLLLFEWLIYFHLNLSRFKLKSVVSKVIVLISYPLIMFLLRIIIMIVKMWM